MEEHAKAYAKVRESLCDLVSSLDDGAASIVTAGCPEWRVKDVLAHVASSAAELSAGRFPSGDLETWISEQVEARHDKSISELITEWSDGAPGFEKILTTMPGIMSGALTGDVVTHEQDIRGAIGKPGARGGAGFELALAHYAEQLGTRITGAGLGTLRIRHNGGEIVAGGGDAVATVTADDFELVRALTGRRTGDQIASYKWEGDASPYLSIFSSYGTPDAPVIE